MVLVTMESVMVRLNTPPMMRLNNIPSLFKKFTSLCHFGTNAYSLNPFPPFPSHPMCEIRSKQNITRQKLLTPKQHHKACLMTDSCFDLNKPQLKFHTTERPRCLSLQSFFHYRSIPKICKTIVICCFWTQNCGI